MIYITDINLFQIIYILNKYINKKRYLQNY